MNREGKSVLFRALAQSRANGEFLSALGKVTGTAIKLISLNGADGEVSLGKSLGPFCRLITATQNGKAACQRFLQDAGHRLRNAPSGLAARCPAGLIELCVPVVVGGQLQAILTCSQFLCGKPTQTRFSQTLLQLRRAQVPVNCDRARKCYFRMTAITDSKQQLLLQLLSLLARQIGALAELWLVAPHDNEPPCVSAAKGFVQAHLTEIVRTRDAAHAAHVTEPHFCRVFKATTGMRFSEYVARLRVERAKKLLGNPSLRVTEVAGAAGFQSIPHFNHTFKRYTGKNPSAYRFAPKQATSNIQPSIRNVQ